MITLFKSLKLILLFALTASLNFSAEAIESYKKWDAEIVEIFKIS